jgi:Ca-activated chloride channel homolog
MKKLLSVAIAVMVILVLTLSGCGSGAPATTDTKLGPTTTATPGPTITSPGYHPPTTTQTIPQTSSPHYVLPTIEGYKPPTTYSPPAYMTVPSSEGNIGLATGGAKDVNNFRENIRNNYLPLPTDITYEGLFYDYFFDMGQTEPSRKLFSPSYSFAVTRDPFSRQTDYYLAVGLNSGMKESDFERKKLNLTIVLDNSGSMGEQFTEYYYDASGKRTYSYSEEGLYRQTKMQSANESVAAILDQLNADDCFSIVLFNTSASLVKPMGPVKRTDMRKIQDHVLDVRAGGSTNLAAGIKMGTEQYRGFYELNNYEYENRMIILTDAQPNTGDIDSSDLMGTLGRNANNGIYTTVIGIGVDFNSQLIEEITKTKGANYYSVHSAREFRERVEDEFEYMVTPLIFDLRMDLEGRGWRIEQVFGSPEADAATGELMKINTLFASKSEGGEVKGGIVLLKLKKTSSSPNEAVTLTVSYEDRNGRKDSSEAKIYMERQSPEYFDNDGIRKGVLLTRYASLLQNWLIDERTHLSGNRSWNPYISEDTGLLIPTGTRLSQWERQSLPLRVSGSYEDIFRDFSRYFEDEMDEIGDYTLEQELNLLEELSGDR